MFKRREVPSKKPWTQLLEKSQEEGGPLAVHPLRIQQIPEDAGQSQFVSTQIVERVEAVREDTIEFAVNVACCIQTRSESPEHVIHPFPFVPAKVLQLGGEAA